jgi:hypothetical protein
MPPLEEFSSGACMRPRSWATGISWVGSLDRPPCPGTKPDGPALDCFLSRLGLRSDAWRLTEGRSRIMDESCDCCLYIAAGSADFCLRRTGLASRSVSSEVWVLWGRLWSGDGIGSAGRREGAKALLASSLTSSKGRKALLELFLRMCPYSVGVAVCSNGTSSTTVRVC